MLLTAIPGQVTGQNLESVLMPGKVIRGHARYESDCGNCHVRFDRAAQPGLCLDCHKDVATDAKSGAGYHGRLKSRECRSCHTEHKGRDANVVALDEKSFDHAQTDMALRGKHAALTCRSCHRAGQKHRAAPSECVGCHRKDDKHKGNLGTRCADCHSDKKWGAAHFDHTKTEFPLRQRHAQVRCADCHRDQHYKDTPRKCVACHRNDDAHKSRFGDRCETCHSEDSWKAATFRHDRDTRFVLRERHRAVKCENCHRSPLYQVKTPTDCHSCHRGNDVHKGALGEKCANCHSEAGWRTKKGFDHDIDTAFVLRDRHRETRCEQCHSDLRFLAKTPSTCVGCHRHDDLENGHKERFGDKCASCHTERGWKKIRFDHLRDARYALEGRHGLARCDSCHQGVLYRDKLQTRCSACHEKDDKHLGQLGARCESCHTPRDWHATNFDHQRSNFPLLGRHATTRCIACHDSAAYKDAKPGCVSCHVKDDRHKERLGPRCELCHNESGWKDWDFAHDLRTKFSLRDAHAKAGCVQCHTKPVKDKFETTSDCLSCHRGDDVHFGTYGTRCDECHGGESWRKLIKRDGVVDTKEAQGRVARRRP